ncbi:MAG: hypothetical protein IPG67_07175 [Acidobacteria bacterium]|nr:hypothetical protein [Acidobacteriota bacterium]
MFRQGAYAAFAESGWGGGLRAGWSSGGRDWVTAPGQSPARERAQVSDFNSIDEIIRSTDDHSLLRRAPYLRAGYGHDPRPRLRGFWRMGAAGCGAGGGGAAGCGWAFFFGFAATQCGDGLPRRLVGPHHFGARGSGRQFVAAQPPGDLLARHGEASRRRRAIRAKPEEMPTVSVARTIVRAFRELTLTRIRRIDQAPP